MHCPPGTSHVIVGAGDTSCTVFAVVRASVTPTATRTASCTRPTTGARTRWTRPRSGMERATRRRRPMPTPHTLASRMPNRCGTATAGCRTSGAGGGYVRHAGRRIVPAGRSTAGGGPCRCRTAEPPRVRLVRSAVLYRVRVADTATTPDITVVPANQASWEDLQAVLGTRGDPHRCQCQRYKMQPGESGPRSERRARLSVPEADRLCSPGVGHDERARRVPRRRARRLVRGRAAHRLPAPAAQDPRPLGRAVRRTRPTTASGP